MTRDEAIAVILGRCGQRQNDAVLQAACVTEMNMVVADVLEKDTFKPWFLLSEGEVATVTVGEERLPLPPRFLEEYEEGSLYIRESAATDWILLTKDDYDVNQARYGFDSGQPRRYSIVGDYIMLSPPPDIAYQARMRHYKKQLPITEAYGSPGAVVDHAWLINSPMWLIGAVGTIIAGEYIKDQPTADRFAALAKDSRDKVYKAHVAREEANRMRQMGED
jgi:hypothetical protein